MAAVTHFSPSQQVVLAIVPKVTSLLSIVGNFWIILEVSHDRRKLGLVYHRMVLEMSAFNLLNVASKGLSTWPMLVGTPNVYGAVGNRATCTAQGFFMQLGGASYLYEAFLATYYMLVLRDNWRERRLRRLENAALASCGLLALGSSIAGIPLTLYNGANFWCWIAEFPAGCVSTSEDSVQNDEMTRCVRGNNAVIYRFAFAHAWTILSFVVISASMVLLFRSIRRHVRRAKRYTLGGTLERKRIQVGVQGMYYVVTFLSVMIFSSMDRIIQAVTGTTYFPLALLVVIFEPLKGFWNCLIYLRPRFKSYKEKDPALPLRRVIKLVLRRAVLSSKAANDEADDDHALGNCETDDHGSCASVEEAAMPDGAQNHSRGSVEAAAN